MVKALLLFQLISLRTAPVAVADQFAIVPADLAGMGGVRIAVRDALADPFINPAAGARITTSRILGAPYLYSVSHGSGAGRTLPVGILGRSGAWFGGFMLSLQQVDPARPPQQFFPPVGFAQPAIFPCCGGPVTTPLPDRPHGNSYGVLALGRAIGDGTSLGIAASFAQLGAMDGVDQLYAGHTALAQHGHEVDARVGLVHQGAEAVLVMNRFAMTHDVTWSDMTWDPNQQQLITTPRLVINRDQTNTLGAHLGIQRPLAAGWTWGAIATVNRLDHPEIPDFVIQSVPRDPGRSWAADLGLGAARQAGPTTFAVDVVVEPAWSHTWNTARTIDNRFAFNNYMMRMGVGRRSGPAEVQLGLAVTSVGYTLEQQDLAAGTARSDQESWVEWTPTWGLALHFPDLELRYSGSAVNGTGRPLTTTNGCCFAQPLEGDAAGPSILVTPGGPLTLQNVTIVTHRVMVAVPIR